MDYCCDAIKTLGGCVVALSEPQVTVQMDASPVRQNRLQATCMNPSNIAEHRTVTKTKEQWD